jgi:hypothetical protein
MLYWIVVVEKKPGNYSIADGSQEMEKDTSFDDNK